MKNIIEIKSDVCHRQECIMLYGFDLLASQKWLSMGLGKFFLFSQLLLNNLVQLSRSVVVIVAEKEIILRLDVVRCGA